MAINHVDLASLFELYDQSDEIKNLVANNIGILKCVRGGLRMAEQHRLEFDPRADYWRRPERRLPVAYLADHWTSRFAPASALRSVALQLTTWFDQARPAVVTYIGANYENAEAGGFSKVAAALAAHARKMGSTPAWDELRSAWSDYKADLAATLGDDVAGFLDQAPTRSDWESGFKQRLPWFGYLGATDNDDVRRRQAFFYGFANLWTTTNAYRSGGAQHFAPVIQNTSAGYMLDAASSWEQGRAGVPVFRVLGKSDADDDPQDRALHAPVLEVYGFLNLERVPYHLTASNAYREWFELPEGLDSPYEQTSRVGEMTRDWLSQHPELVETSDHLFRKLLSVPLSTPVVFEAIVPPKMKKLASSEAALVDDALRAELESTAMAELKKLTPSEGAAVALHLLLAGKAYQDRTPAKPQAAPPPPGPSPEQKQPKSDDMIGPLPGELRPHGERALAYLKAGLHVLFAGAPGTGKTTLAQFVGHAWDQRLESLPTHIPRDEAPLTTVGNSAWSPFHTIGGLMPNADGKFDSHPGIFIEPGSTTGAVWRLLNRSLVLDEMNRADLDRCIGELYPLLSGSVRRVSPAGLPGVTCIEASDRFRVIATINDAHLDDIVFPISEGLARRFQRIELRGGSLDDVLAYLDLDAHGSDGDPRRVAASDAVGLFFEMAREAKLLSKDVDDDRLPFGVAYFALLREWVAARLSLPESTLPEQARDLLAASLRPLGRSRKWDDALRAFLAKV